MPTDARPVSAAPAPPPLRPLDPRRLRLYLVLDPDTCMLDPLEVARQAILGGVTCVQWRVKRMDQGARQPLAAALRQLCADQGVLFIVNDDVQAAVDLEADGAHVGQDDMASDRARGLLGPDRILGQSVRSLNEAYELVPELVDYAGIYPVFHTRTKQDVPDPLSIATFAQIVRRTPVPSVGIGGITARNAPQVITAGAAGVAVVSAICGSAHPRQAAADLKRAVDIALFRS